MSPMHGKHVNLQFFTRWGSEQLHQIKISVARYLASFKMGGITIVSHVFDEVLQGKARLVVRIKVSGTNVKHTISEFAKKVIYDLKAIPMYRENHAHA